VSSRPERDEIPDDDDGRTLAEDDGWVVPEQYRVEPRAPQPDEGETVFMEAAPPPDATPPPARMRRFPPDLGPGLALALIGVLLVVLLVPAGIWLSSRDDGSEPGTTSPPETSTEPTNPPTPPATTRKVPDVVGLPLAQARERLAEATFEVRFRRVPSDRPPGEVLEQEARPNGIVVLTISGGPERVAVPEVEGATVAEATATLRDVGLRVEVRRVVSTEPEGTVIVQTPASGEEVDRETVVVLDVAKSAPPPPPETVEVPDLVGLTSSEARSRLSELGLRWTQRPFESSRPQGTVLRQSPGAGAELREGGRVTLTVSTGPAKLDVPDVVGLDEVSARAELRAAGFQVTVVDEPTFEPADDGIVLRQSPRAGARRPEGSVVTITIARFS
jgi:beta-lactam-binding protein with PASTA domain